MKFLILISIIGVSSSVFSLTSALVSQLGSVAIASNAAFTAANLCTFCFIMCAYKKA